MLAGHGEDLANSVPGIAMQLHASVRACKQWAKIVNYGTQRWRYATSVSGFLTRLRPIKGGRGKGRNAADEELT